MQVNGITWHASVMEKDRFNAMRELFTGAAGLTPMMELPGVVVFATPDGSILEFYEQGSEMVPPYGYNDGGIAFGFRVDDIEAASAELEAGGAEILGDIQRAEMDGRPYAYRHFRAPDGRVYGLNELR
jgi:catechol 2,3-dioxygenase-like lactoylglutathione lyase family enzyme